MLDENVRCADKMDNPVALTLSVRRSVPPVAAVLSGCAASLLGFDLKNGNGLDNLMGELALTGEGPRTER